MIEHSIVFIGLDTHKEFIEIAYIEDQRGATPTHFGRISSSKVANFVSCKVTDTIFFEAKFVTVILSIEAIFSTAISGTNS